MRSDLGRLLNVLDLVDARLVAAGLGRLGLDLGGRFSCMP